MKKTATRTLAGGVASLQDFLRLESAGELVLMAVTTAAYQAPNANAYAERFVRSVKEECLDRLVPLGGRHLRRAISEYAAHYHHERNHQGIENALIVGAPVPRTVGRTRRRARLGGLLNYYERAA